MGVGGICASNTVSSPGRTEFEIEEDRLEGELLSRIVSDFRDAELAPFRSLNFRENEGKRVPNRVARPLSADSLPLRFLVRGDVENSPSVKNPSAIS